MIIPPGRVTRKELSVMRKPVLQFAPSEPSEARRIPAIREWKTVLSVPEKIFPERSDRNHRGSVLRLSGSLPRRMVQSLWALCCTRRYVQPAKRIARGMLMQASVAKTHDLKIPPVATRKRRGAGSTLAAGTGGGISCAVTFIGDEKGEEPMEGIQDCELRALRLFSACGWKAGLLAACVRAIIPGSSTRWLPRGEALLQTGWACSYNGRRLQRLRSGPPGGRLPYFGARRAQG